MNEKVIETVVEPIAAALDLELDSIKIIGAGKRAIVRIALDGDGANGTGPDLDQITAATQKISRALDEADLGESAYTLEVGTRGVSAPLTKLAHFRRNCGRLVEVAAGEKHFTGRIVSANDDERIVFEVDGENSEVALSDIEKAVVVIEFNNPKKES